MFHLQGILLEWIEYVPTFLLIQCNFENILVLFVLWIDADSRVHLQSLSSCLNDSVWLLTDFIQTCSLNQSTSLAIVLLLIVQNSTTSVGIWAHSWIRIIFILRILFLQNWMHFTYFFLLMVYQKLLWIRYLKYFIFSFIAVLKIIIVL